MGAPEGGQGSRTLGELLYADEKDPASERDWMGLVHSIAARQPLALRALYQRTHRLVFTSSMRITKARESAEQATLDVFHDVWRRAAGYDAAAETVLGWIMNLARYRAIEWAQFEPRKQHVGQGEGEPRDLLRGALSSLTPEEREAIEAALLGELNQTQMAARLDQPLGSVKRRIRSGLAKLGSALATTSARPSAAGARCGLMERVSSFAVYALAPGEMPVMQAHVWACPDCGQELERLLPVVDAFVHWPTDVLRPSPSLWGRLARRIAVGTGWEALAWTSRDTLEPEWKEVASGISCKLLATDLERNRVSMLVRLAPGIAYPPHTHAGVEELHLLDGELWIDDRQLAPGDYSRAEPGSEDRRVWSATGCTCVLVTSTRDVLR